MQIQRTGYQQNFGESIILKATAENQNLLHGLATADNELWSKALEPQCRLVMRELTDKDGYTTRLLADGEEAKTIHSPSLKYLSDFYARKNLEPAMKKMQKAEDRIAARTTSQVVISSIADIMNLPIIQRCSEGTRQVIEQTLRVNYHCK